MQRRDQEDAERQAAPLRKAADAELLDTTGLTPDAAFAAALELVRIKLGIQPSRGTESPRR
jgi:CMP/dCMP kinase